MTPFSSVSHVQFGCHRLLRALHQDEMRKMREASRDEREQHAERASQIRQMMEHFDMVRLVGGALR